MVLKLVSPDIGSAGVERDEPTPPGQGTRALATNCGKRRRLDDDSAMASLAAKSAALTEAITKQAGFGEPATLSETLKNLRAAIADPRFTAAVERKLESELFPTGETAACAAVPEPDGSSAASLDGRTGGLPAGEGVVDDDESDLFM